MSPKDFGQAKLINHWLIKQKDNKHNDVAAENKIKKFFTSVHDFEWINLKSLLNLCKVQLTVP